MQFLPLFSAVWGVVPSNIGLLAAIVALACILGAEVAGIAILISKLLRARRARYERSMEESEEERNSSYRNYGVAAVLLFGAVPKATYITLTVLAVLAAVAAVVFLVLLIVFRACGYDFASLDRYREEQARKKRVAEDARSAPELPEDVEKQNQDQDLDQEETLFAAEERLYGEEGEEQRQDAYTLLSESVEEEPFEVFAEEPDRDESVSEESDAEPAAVAVTPVTQTEAAVMPAEGEPAFADGTRPYKVVEKVVTETYKEIYKETPPATAAQPVAQSNPATDAVMEKLADFLDYELQKRKEEDRANAEKDAEEKDSVPVVATGVLYDDEDDEEEEDDDDLDEGEDAKKEDDEDSDNEENDTEGDHFTGNERIIGFDEETGCYIVAHYRKSFEAKLIQARPNIKKYYSELKNALLSYKGSKNRISWTADSFHNGRTPIAKINVKTRILELYLALDPASLEGTVYRGKDVGNKKKYADTPFQYKLRTPRKFKWAMELVQRVCEEHGLSPIDIEHVNYDEQYPFDTTENLVERKLIKEYIRQEKPATTFELAPDHVPTVPEEDESVIPANANFSWEFDNEVLEEKEPEPIAEEEPEVTPEPEPEPTPELESTPEPTPTPAEPAPTVVRETVKVTEMRYTERYYADAKPTYEQVVSTTEPIEAEAVPADATVETVFEPTEKESTDVSEPQEAEQSVDTAEETDAADGSVDIWSDLFVDGEQEAEEESVQEAEEALESEEASDELFFSDEPAVEEAVAEEADVDLYEEAVENDASQDGDDEISSENAEEIFEENEEYEEYDEVTEVSESEEAEPAASMLVSEPVPIESPAPVAPRRILNPSVAVVDICAVESYFEPDDVVKLESLKVLGLVLPTATVLKIYANGMLSKPLTVEANHFTLDAIKAISDADGDAVMVR